MHLWGLENCRCDDETTPALPSCPHCGERAETWFDRSECPEPCGSMHERCDECGRAMGYCPLEVEPTPADLTDAAHRAAKAAGIDADGNRLVVAKVPSDWTPDTFITGIVKGKACAAIAAGIESQEGIE